VHRGGNQKHRLDFEVHSNRVKGFREAHSDAVLAHDHDFLADACDIFGGYRNALRVSGKSERCMTATTAASDEIAIGALTTAREPGIQVPEELSIISMDGHLLGKTFGFATMNQHPATRAGIAVSQALARLSGAWDETWMRTWGGGGPKNPPQQRPSA